jgi:acyl carrier protein
MARTVRQSSAFRQMREFAALIPKLANGACESYLISPSYRRLADLRGKPVVMEREDLVNFIQTHLGVNTSSLSDDTPLFSSGLIDSFSLVSVMSFLESKGRFRIHPVDVSLDNLDSIGRILRFVERMSG